MYRLLSATPSPFARKVRIVLHEKNVPFELITEVPWDDDALAPSVNPLGKIPVLLLDDETSYYESDYIVEFLEIAHPEIPVLPADPLQRLQHRRFEVLADGLCDALVLALIERTRQPAQCSEIWIERQMGKAARALTEISALASSDAQAIAGQEFGLADIAVGSALGYMDLRFPKINWRAEAPHLEVLFDALSQRESFMATVPSAQTISSVVA